MLQHHNKASKSALKIAVIYAVFGGLWIIFSDRFLASFFSDTASLNIMQTFKGWFYVTITAFLVYMLIYHKLKMIQDSQNEILQSEKRYRSLFQNAPVSIIELDLSEIKNLVDQLHSSGISNIDLYLDMRPEFVQKCFKLIDILNVNQVALDQLGIPDKDSLVENFNNFTTPDTTKFIKKILVNIFKDKREFESHLSLVTIQGVDIYWAVRLSVVGGYENTWKKVLICALDITETKKHEIKTKKLELQLLQAQKMETIGSMASGIAHDFKNLLTPLYNYAELVLDELPPGQVRDNQEQVLNAAQRAGELANRILTFGRQNDHEIKTIDINLVVDDAIKLVRSLLPATVSIHYDPLNDTPPVMADPSQIHQVILNICTNAVHAMGRSGGMLSVVVKSVYSNLIKNNPPNLPDGKYVEITISDTGHGIDNENLTKIFDPFFTTKKAGEGTGLGLSVVHGIVKSHGGDITVESEKGKGTSFRVYLPLAHIVINDDTDTHELKSDKINAT